MIQPKYIFWKYIGGYKLTKSQEKFNHLMNMDDIKLFVKKKNTNKKLETQIHAVRIYSQDIGMEFPTQKCVLLIMRSGKRQMMGGIDLLNQEKIRTLGEKEAYKYLGILEADTIKQPEMKEKIKKEYLKRTRKLLEIKLYNRNHNQKDKHLGCCSCKILGIILKVGERRTKTNGPENKKIHVAEMTYE